MSPVCIHCLLHLSTYITWCPLSFVAASYAYIHVCTTTLSPATDYSAVSVTSKTCHINLFQAGNCNQSTYPIVQESITGNQLAQCLVPTQSVSITQSSLLILCLDCLLQLSVRIGLQSPMPMSPVPIYSPLCQTQFSLPIVLFLASYVYTTMYLVSCTVSSLQLPIVFYCNRLQCCSSNSPITARHVVLIRFKQEAAITVMLILKGN